MRATIAAILLVLCGTAHAESGIASVDYGRPTRFDGGNFHGLVATGERFNPSVFAVAHCSLPLKSRVIVAYRRRVAIAVVNDRGPCCTPDCRHNAPLRVLIRKIDLTPALARYLGFPGLGVVEYWPVA